MKEEIEKRRAEAAEKKKQKAEETPKPAFALSPKGSSKVKCPFYLALRSFFFLYKSSFIHPDRQTPNLIVISD